MKIRTYVISQDLWILFSGWAKRLGFKIPDKNYFIDLSKGIASDLQSIFDKSGRGINVELISSDKLHKQIGWKLPKASNDAIISLDKVYFAGNFQLEINRAVRKEREKWEDLDECSRPGFISIDQQFDSICSKINGNNRVLVVDDGCWSGDSISWAVKELQKRNINVDKVLVGIFIDSGKSLLNVPLEFIIRYSADSILDWICERDFLLGAPYGGRTVVDDSLCELHRKSYGAYYLWGMGDYVNWASLNLNEDLVKWFTKQCILRAIHLFCSIEDLSGKPVLMNDLSRLPYGIEFEYNEKFIDVLGRLDRKIKVC
jgi:hypothetical protein